MARWDEFEADDDAERLRREHEAENADGLVGPKLVEQNPRQEIADDTGEILKRHRSWHLKILLFLPLLIALGLIVKFISLMLALEVTTGVTLLGIGMSVWSSSTIKFGFYQTLFAMVIGGFFATTLLPTRLMASTVLATMTLVIYIGLAKYPFQFYYQWLFAGPGLRNDAWILPNALWTPGPSILVVAAFLIFMVVIPAVHSVSFAIAFILIILAGLFCIILGTTPFRNPGDSALDTVHLALEFAQGIEAVFVGYPDTDPRTNAWKAPFPRWQRRLILILLYGSMIITTAVSLSYCIPYEIFGAWFQQGFVWTIPHSQPEEPYQWLLLPFAMALTAKPAYIWCILIGSVLSLFLPFLILFVAFMPALLHANYAANSAKLYVEELGPKKTGNSFIDITNQLKQSQNFIDRRRGLF